MKVGSAVTMSFMGIAYWLIPYLTRRQLVGRGMAVVQSWVYFIGVLIMARGLISGGLDGMPRRTLIIEAAYSKPGWELRLDRLRYWVVAAVVLILIAYGPFLVQYLPGNFASPPYRFF